MFYVKKHAAVESQLRCVNTLSATTLNGHLNLGCKPAFFCVVLVTVPRSVLNVVWAANFNLAGSHIHIPIGWGAHVKGTMAQYSTQKRTATAGQGGHGQHQHGHCRILINDAANWKNPTSHAPQRGYSAFSMNKKLKLSVAFGSLRLGFFILLRKGKFVGKEIQFRT
jgi:hypothetical protein